MPNLVFFIYLFIASIYMPMKRKNIRMDDKSRKPAWSRKSKKQNKTKQSKNKNKNKNKKKQL